MPGGRVRAATAVMVFLLDACSAAPDPPPGAMTTDETSQLNDAAVMLAPNSISLDAIAKDRKTP